MTADWEWGETEEFKIDAIVVDKQGLAYGNLYGKCSCANKVGKSLRSIVAYGLVFSGVPPGIEF